MLSKHQNVAINYLKTHPGHSILVPSIAGAGKTRTLEVGGEFLVDVVKADPEHIIYLTFTSTAAQNLVCKLRYDYKLVDTFHALPGLVKGETMTPFNEDEDDDLYHCDIELLQLAKYLDTDESADFKEQVKHVFVDEIQDCNYWMKRVLQAFHKAGAVIIGAGDVYQAIMAFQGGSIEVMTTFVDTFAPSFIVQLPVNYRCSTNIVRLARAIKKNGKQYPELYPHEDMSLEEWNWEESKTPMHMRQTLSRKPTLKHYYQQYKMVEDACKEIKRKLQWRKPDELVVLCRKNESALAIRAQLLKMGIDNIIYRKSAKQMKRLNQKRKFDHTADIKQEEDDIRNSHKGKVRVATIHSSKGDQWKDGVIVDLHDLNFPSSREPNLQNERNLFYVAVTRFQEDVTLFNCHPQTSTFLLELERDGVLEDLFQTPVLGNFPNVSVHEGDSTEEKVKQAIPLQPSNFETLIKDASDWIKRLNGCSYLYIAKHFRPTPLNLAIRNIPLLYTVPHMKEEEWTALDAKEDDEDDEIDDGDYDEDAMYSDSDTDSLPEEVDVEGEEDCELDPHQHSEWIQRECMEEEITDFLDCWVYRTLQQFQGLSSYTFPPAETFYTRGSPSSMTAALIESNRLKVMYSAYQRRYQDANIQWENALSAIYWTSAFTAVHAGNVALMYIRINDTHLLEYKFMMDEIFSTLHYLIYGPKGSKGTQSHSSDGAKFQIHSFFGIVGARKPDPYIIIDDNRLLLWSNQVAEGGNSSFPQELVMKGLIYAALHSQVRGKAKVQQVQIYHTFSRRICTIDISNWKNVKQKKLLVYLQTVKKDVFPDS